MIAVVNIEGKQFKVEKDAQFLLDKLQGKKGDKVVAFADESPVDTVLGVEIFPVIHVKSQEKIYVSLEDIKDD